eukprot:9486388-Karenia_brevis.AAC.1
MCALGPSLGRRRARSKPLFSATSHGILAPSRWLVAVGFSFSRPAFGPRAEKRKRKSTASHLPAALRGFLGGV